MLKATTDTIPVSISKSLLQNLSILIVSAILAACGGGGGGSADNIAPPLLATTVLGSVGDGPIIGANITIVDVNGNIVATTVSDAQARYEAIVPKNTKFPVTITATGGTDLVTGTTPDFDLLTVALRKADISSKKRTANLNPFSTFIVKMAQHMPGGISSENITAAKQIVYSQFHFGLDSALVQDPISTKITEENIASVVKASEVMGEMVRRTRDAIITSGTLVIGDNIVDSLSSDLVDGLLDGKGGNDTNSRYSALSHIVTGQVMLESIVNHLRVGGVEATAAMDAAIRTILPNSSAVTSDVLITNAIISETKSKLAAAKIIDSNPVLDNIITALDSITDGATAASVDAALPSNASDSLESTVLVAALAADIELENIHTAVNISINQTSEDGSVNTAPIITGNPPTEVAEVASYSFTPSASDADGDSLSFGISNKPVWASFNTATGALTGTPDINSSGTYVNIVVSVSDGSVSASLPAFAITVSNTNVAPTINGTPAMTVAEGASYSFTPSASDTDGDSLSFSINNKPAWASFNAATGALTGTPDSSSVGNFENIVISVNDGTASTSLSAFNIMVTAASISVPFTNRTPVTYEWDTLENGKMIFIDEDFIFGSTVDDQVPDAYAGLFYLRTAKADRRTTGESHVSFSANVPVTVYVAHHNNFTIRPVWLSTWIDTGDDIANRSIFRKDFDAGSISLGGNTVDGIPSGSMYFVIVKPLKKSDIAMLSWVAPSTKEDGSVLSLSELDGFRIYRGTSSDNMEAILDINDATTTQYSFFTNDMTSGTYYYSVSAYDVDGNESEQSSISTLSVQ